MRNCMVLWLQVSLQLAWRQVKYKMWQTVGYFTNFSHPKWEISPKIGPTNIFYQWLGDKRLWEKSLCYFQCWRLCLNWPRWQLCREFIHCTPEVNIKPFSILKPEGTCDNIHYSTFEVKHLKTSCYSLLTHLAVITCFTILLHVVKTIWSK